MASANTTQTANDRLVIFRGDDTGGAFGRTLAFTIDAAEGVSLEGCRAEWIFDGIVKTFDAPLVPGEVREVFYSHNETRRMALGVRYGTFRIIDAAGKVRTFTNTKAVEVTDNAARCYPGSSSATVRIGTTVTWEQVSGKPLLVRTINGEAPDASGNIQIGTGGDVKHSDFADIEEKEGMTLKEVGSMCNALVRKLKGTVAAFAAILAFGAFAYVPLSPDMDFGDVHPTNKLKAVVVASGAIGGTDTNAVRDIIHATVDGAARVLPKYLHALDFCDSYTNDAAWFYAQPQPYGACSARRVGGIVERNYDWKFDDAAEFVVRMAAGRGRFASIGVANVGTNLTETLVTSGKWSRYFKCLPGHTVDGINSEGVVCEVNVVGGEPHESGWPTTGTIHCLGAVRWVLDHATNAASAASVLAAGVYFPSGWSQNFHWMIADAAETWIVENGAAHQVTNGVPAMTNFRLYGDPKDTTGEGQERYDLLLSCACCITQTWWTATYTPQGYRPSDLPGIDKDLVFSAWASGGRESHRGKTFGDKTWWQTVHTSVYDISNRVLRVAVQERDDWYTFAVPSSGGGIAEERDPVALPRVAALEAEVAAIPRITESNDHEGWAKYADYAMEADYATEAREADEVGGYTGGDFDDMYERVAENTESIATNAADLASHVADTNNPHGVTAEQVGAYSTTETDVKLEGKVNAKGGGDLDGQYGIAGSLVVNGWFTVTDDATVDPYYTDVLSQGIMISLWGATTGVARVYYDFYGIGFDFADGRPPARIYIPQKSGTFALTSDVAESLTNADATAWAATSATNSLAWLATHAQYTPDPTDTTFSNAVLAVGLNIDTNSVAVLNEIAATFGDFPLGPGETATTLGGLLAALAAAVAWLRKRAAHLDNSGFGDNEFAADLLGKQVAISAIDARIDFKIGNVNAVLAAALDGTEVA